MMDYKKSREMLETFYDNCKMFWLREGNDEKAAHELALADVARIKSNPFSPNGEALDKVAKEDFLKGR